ncbi:hypothetical protein GCM10009788_46550 [Nocardioides humi]|uniref:VOC domain-containing protein n=1 Tax=Nocardioides humi TaxID=449461 RepID=A0ABN2BFI1_9ACTN
MTAVGPQPDPPARPDPAAPYALAAGLHVSDLAASERFYVALLGFSVFGRLDLPNGRLAALRFGNSMLKLLQWDEPRGPREAGPVLGIRYLTVHVTDPDEIVRQAVARGHAVVRAPYSFSESVRVAFVADPDGNHVELCAGVAWSPVGSDGSGA